MTGTESTHNADDQDDTAAHIVSFSSGDPEDPRNWPRWRKLLIVGAITLIDLSVSWGASGYSPASSKFAKDFHVSSEVGTLGLSIYIAGLALGPMSLAPLSEYLGRSPVYIVSYFIYLMFLLGTALIQDLGGFLALRFLSGVFAAVTIANFGGTIADLYSHQETGPAMSIFLWAATGGSSSGYFLMAFVAQYRGWRDVFWALLGISGGFWLIMTAVLLYCGETRHNVLLLRRAKALHKSTGNSNITVPSDMRRRGVRQLFSVALSRPFRFLGTEAIVIFAALYNGFLYGLSYLFNGAFGVVFGADGHGFDVLQVGLCFLGIFIGISLGPITNLWQERYYQRRLRADADPRHANIPEARVQLGKLAAIAHPIALFIYAWTTYPRLPWIAPVLASGLWGWSFYTLILMTYTFTEDAYGMFSASALAGIGLVRNAAGAGFPLFGNQMFVNEGYQWAGSILAFLALLLVPIPFVLERYGAKLRRRSPWASTVIEQGQDISRKYDGEEDKDGYEV